MKEPAAIKISAQRIVCTGCGAEGRPSCNCGLPYVPKAVRAAEAIKANPGKSDRAIAAEIGVSQPTVSQVRKDLGDKHLSPERRTGLDGKSYPVKPPPPSDEEEEDAKSPEPKHMSHPSDEEAKQIYDSAPKEVQSAVNAYLSLTRKERNRAWQLINLYDQKGRPAPSLIVNHHAG